MGEGAQDGCKSEAWPLGCVCVCISKGIWEMGLDNCSSQVPLPYCHQCCSLLTGAGIGEFVQRTLHEGSGAKSKPLLLSSNGRLRSGSWWEVGEGPLELPGYLLPTSALAGRKGEKVHGESLDPATLLSNTPMPVPPTPQWLATHSDEQSHLLSRALSPPPNPTQHQASPPPFQLYRLSLYLFKT